MSGDTAGLRVSVVIVSRMRPRELGLCLLALDQQYFAQFEVVLVADSATLAGLDPRWRGRIKTLPFDEPNISAARNLGITAAAGDIIAFIDDDATAEPAWLGHLTAPFSDPAVASAGGFVRGRNGISYQWRGRSVDAEARHRDIDTGLAPLVLPQAPGRAVKTEGTNMALRRRVVALMGGFDPAYRFYLDETDLNLRLAAAGHAAALAPRAEVHHAFAASERRSANRLPHDLTEVGASLAVFLRRHAGGADPARLAEEEAERRAGLAAHARAGRIDAAGTEALIASLRAGWTEGLARGLTPPPPIGPPTAEFLPFRSGAAPTGHLAIGGRAIFGRRLRRQAAAAVAAGQVVSLHLFGPGMRRHSAGFDAAGYWLQSGGRCGRSLREDPPWRFWRSASRIARETRLRAPFRDPPDAILPPH